jgi:hypothetical protein
MVFHLLVVSVTVTESVPVTQVCPETLADPLLVVMTVVELSAPAESVTRNWTMLAAGSPAPTMV